VKATTVSKTLIVLLCVNLFFTNIAEARRHKKFKGVIIVNQILKLTGTITRNGEDAPEFSGVKQGDVLETADKSSAVIRIPGLALFQMGPNTKLKLTQFNDRNESRFELFYGDFVALFRRVGVHEVKLPHGLLRLHGTTFFVLSPKDAKSDQICLEEGRIDVSVLESFVKPEPAPTAVGTPLYHASLSAAATPTGGTVPSPTPTPAPTVQPVSSTSAQLTTTDEPKSCEVTAQGVDLNPHGNIAALHSKEELRELESLYELP
jgi:hypothetical protein